MPAKTQSLKFKRSLNAPVSEAYRAFTNAAALREWFSDSAQADPRKGGRLYLAWNSGYYVAGEYLSAERDRKVAFTWFGKGDPGPTRVQVTLAAKNGAAALTLTHGGLGAGKAWAGAAREMAREWQDALDNLASVLETGQDRRFVLRPMLGVTVDEFDAEIAKKMGAPVSEGIRLGGVVEGMGAQAAGLKSGDVIVSIGGKKVAGWGTLAAALQRHRAGDKVAVGFYRGGEKHAVTMELSRRPLPEVPPTPAALADAVQSLNHQVVAELEKCFDGVSETEASFRPGPGEWSPKEVVAHFIVGERDAHWWIAGLIAGRVSAEWPGNIPARTGAIVAVTPGVPALLEELRRNQAETVAMLRALPDDFVAHKAAYWNLGYNLLQPFDHAREHCAQIRAAVEAARRRG